MNQQWSVLALRTFVACFSEHGGTNWDASDRDHQEDAFGRLSMWRAYGRGSGVALVLNHKPFMSRRPAWSRVQSPTCSRTKWSTSSAGSPMVWR
jgi:hypothetical protein